MKTKFRLSIILLAFFLAFSFVGSTVYAENLPNTTLLYLQRGQAVKQVQMALNKIGYKISADGIYGQATRTAVLAFQKKYSSLANDGIYGSSTRAAMQNVLNKPNNNETTKLPNRSLKYLERGSDVKSVQTVLKELGYKLSIDGIYGRGTKATVLAFQRKHSNLINDGIYGPSTRAAMVNILNKSNNNETTKLPNRSLKYLERGSDVKSVQLVLKELGYKLSVDGIYGRGTKATVLAFQKKHSNLTNDGIYGPSTRLVLLKSLNSGSTDNLPDDTTSGKIAYLTFDDGPSNTNTPAILNILDKYNIKATFFVLGSMAENQPSILKTIHSKGHSIGNHTYSHEYGYIYSNLNNFLGEVDRTDKILKNILGNDFNTSLLRFPGGSFGDSKASYRKSAIDKGYRIYDWNALNGDSEALNVPVSELVARLKETARGQKELIVLMHDTYGKETTVEALPQIIEYLKSQGYSFRALNQ